jgi:hypothetical protein
MLLARFIPMGKRIFNGFPGDDGGQAAAFGPVAHGRPEYDPLPSPF